MEMITVIWLKSPKRIRRAMVYLKGAADISFSDRLAGYAAFAEWERVIPEEKPSGCVNAAVRSSVYKG